MLCCTRTFVPCRFQRLVRYSVMFLCTVFVLFGAYTLSKWSTSFHNTTFSDFQFLISHDKFATTTSLDKDKAGIYTLENNETLTKVLIRNGDICAETRIDFIIYIESHWINVERRRSIRETWIGAKLLPDIIVKSVFILGKPSNRTDQVKINNENLIHSDIVQGDFIDSFQDLTMKSIIALEWIYHHCRQAKFVLKADDDIFVDMFKVVNILLPSLRNESRHIVGGVKEENASIVVREKRSHWYIPDHIFPQRTHLPRFCIGYFVIMTSDLVPELVTASRSAQYTPVDDANLFRLLPQALVNVTYTDISRNITLDDDFALDSFFSGNDFHLIAVGAGKEDYMEFIWREVILHRHKGIL